MVPRKRQRREHVASSGGGGSHDTSGRVVDRPAAGDTGGGGGDSDLDRGPESRGGAGAHGEQDRENVDLEAVAKFFGPAFDTMALYHERLAIDGERRGLIGPRETSRLWSRHILNSAAVVQYLPTTGRVADLGSGAGLPGLVIAAMLPEAEITLIEPMERRTAWLSEMVAYLSLGNVQVRRGRAEEYAGVLEFDAVTSRAVAALDKLGRMSIPLLRVGGEMVVLKGRNVDREMPAGRRALRRLGCSEPEILMAGTIESVENATVVRSVRQTGGVR